MKKSRKNRNMKSVMIVIVCLTFIVGIGAGIGAGTYISNKKAQKTEETKPKDTAQNGGSTVKGDGVKKEEEKNPDTDDTVSNGSNSGSDSDIQNNGQGSSQNQDNTDNGGQPQGSTYDASVPADDTAIHRYEYIISDCTWQEAFQDCLNRGGYLVRINSSKEYESIRKEISRQKMTDVYFKLGGRRDSQSQDYYWVNQDNKLFGEKLNSDSSWCSDEWMGGEPSFRDGDLEEMYMDLFFYDGEKRFVWNDIPDDMLAAEPAYSGKLGYICEYED